MANKKQTLTPTTAATSSVNPNPVMCVDYPFNSAGGQEVRFVATNLTPGVGYKFQVSQTNPSAGPLAFSDAPGTEFTADSTGTKEFTEATSGVLWVNCVKQ